MNKKIPVVTACAIVLGWCGSDVQTPHPNGGGWTAWTTSGQPISIPYADGTYKADGPFMTPIGRDGIVVWVTLANGDGTIAGLSIQPVADTLSMNAEWIDRFSVEIKKVVGKKLSEVEGLGGVSGSTLTYKGFLIALGNIRSQASSQ